jgi:hypothetical protein
MHFPQTDVFDKVDILLLLDQKITCYRNGLPDILVREIAYSSFIMQNLTLIK